MFYNNYSPNVALFDQNHFEPEEINESETDSTLKIRSASNEMYFSEGVYLYISQNK